MVPAFWSSVANNRVVDPVKLIWPGNVASDVQLYAVDNAHADPPARVATRVSAVISDGFLMTLRVFDASTSIDAPARLNTDAFVFAGNPLMASSETNVNVAAVTVLVSGIADVSNDRPVIKTPPFAVVLIPLPT